MKGKKGYPVSCKTKDTVVSAAKARKHGGRACKDLGEIGGGSAKSVHGKPLFSAAGPGSKRK
jgi:hypothetical protein